MPEQMSNQSPDSFESAKAQGEEALLPNRAHSEGGFEASGRAPEGGVCERGEPVRDELGEQALDEAVELTFPASDPVANTDPSHITRVEVELDERGRKVE